MSKPIKHGNGYRIRWTDENGKRGSKTVNDKKAAALALRQEQLAAEERKAGLRKPAQAPRTFADAAAYWETHRAPKKRSYQDDLSILRQLRPHFDAVRLNDPMGLVLAADRYGAIKAKLHNKTLSNHLTLFKSILKLACDLGWMDRLPNIKKPTIKLRAQDYSYLRTDEEVTRFLSAASAEGPMAHMLYVTAVFTGMRAGELAALQWGDINWATRLITVQRSFDGPTKSDEIRFVPILDALLTLLRDWRLQHPGTLVFTNRDGHMFQESARIFQEVLHRVLDRANFPRITRGGKVRRYIHFHDLRHTFASRWIMKGGDLFKLQKILGHKTIEMTQRYAHLQPSAFVDDYARFGGATPVIGEVNNVIPMRR